MAIRSVMNSFRHWDNDDTWISRNPREILSSRVGNCYDTAKLQDYMMKVGCIDHRVFLLVPAESRENPPAHMFVVHKFAYAWAWIEGSWEPYRKNNIMASCPEALAKVVKGLMERHYDIPYRCLMLDSLPGEGLTLGEYRQRLINEVHVSS